MKRLSWFNKVIWVVNVLCAIVTIVAYLLPFLAPKLFPILAVLTLFLPIILIVNLLFFGYWSIQLKRQLLLSGFVLFIGFTFINKFYKFSSEKVVSDKALSIMSYNVRLFNKFGWSEKETVPQEISEFVKLQQPNILCIQEYTNGEKFDYSDYNFKYILKKGNKIKTSHAIFSKFEIVNTGEIIFPNSNNNAIFADLKIDNNLIRVYSIHLESIKITPDVADINHDLNVINQTKSNKIFLMTSKAFGQQQLQSELVMKHKLECKYPVIICGDMNNSAFSYVYRNIKGDLQDAFVVAGSGFGKTYDFKYYPARIDYLFFDEQFKINSFENHTDIKDSDHFPIISHFEILKDSL
ncbi:MAG: hypothetical protein RLZZ312_1670 [Bacteroidota bacterium]|jgi:endonuclease/exonuclease/phosphatase family metal-dependent hydrolase